MTISPIHLMLATLGGAAIAALYLLALRRSVRSLVSRREPGLGTGLVAIARIGMVSVALWAVGAGDGPAILCALLGFLVVRTTALARLRRREAAPAPRHIASSAPSSEAAP